MSVIILNNQQLVWCSCIICPLSCNDLPLSDEHNCVYRKNKLDYSDYYFNLHRMMHAAPPFKLKIATHVHPDTKLLQAPFSLLAQNSVRSIPGVKKSLKKLYFDWFPGQRKGMDGTRWLKMEKWEELLCGRLGKISSLEAFSEHFSSSLWHQGTT